MRAYRFTTTISEEGTIQVPVNSLLNDEEVEVIILPKDHSQSGRKKAIEFVDKWRGSLVSSDPERAKLEYLSDKHK